MASFIARVTALAQRRSGRDLKPWRWREKIVNISCEWHQHCLLNQAAHQTFSACSFFFACQGSPLGGTVMLTHIVVEDETTRPNRSLVQPARFAIDAEGQELTRTRAQRGSSVPVPLTSRIS